MTGQEERDDRCICTAAIAGISDGPSVDCPCHGEARDDEREVAFQLLRDFDDQFDPSKDQRIEAWDIIARHPIFAECFAAESSLIDAMMARLDSLLARKHPEPEITDEMVATALAAWRKANRFLGVERSMRLALESAARVPVGEGEQ